MASTMLSITTTSFSRLRGFTLRVLSILEGGSFTSYEVGLKGEKPTNYVNTYLFRLRSYGLVDKNDCFWFLTEKGARIWELLKRCINIYYTNNRTTTEQQHNNNRSTTLGNIEAYSVLPRGSRKPQKQPLQLSLENWSRKDSLTDCEQRVVEVLLGHYNETGSKFINVNDHYKFSEIVGFNVDVVLEALRRLHQDHVAYAFPNKTLGGWKIALYRDFVDMLQRDNQ